MGTPHLFVASRPRRAITLLVSLALIAASLWIPAQSARGDTLDVCASGCTYSEIQAALDASANGDTISVGAGTYQENLTITTDVTITGSGPATTTVDGGGAGRVVTVGAEVTAVITDLAIVNGLADAATFASPNGGGIINEGDLTLERVEVVGNTAADGGGGIYNTGALAVIDSTIAQNTGMTDGTGTIGGGGIASHGLSSPSVSVIRSSITQNTLIRPGDYSRGGGGIAVQRGVLAVEDSIISDNESGYTAGGIFVSGSGTQVTLARSVVAGNRTGTDPIRNAGNGGGLMLREADVTIVDSTISDNVAASSGGGIYLNATLNVENSTVSGNQAVGAGGGIDTDVNLTLSSVTVVNNTVDPNSRGFAGGGGIYAFDRTVTLDNSIVANNTAAEGTDCYGSVTTTGVALVESTDGTICVSSGNIITGVDPQLGPLQDNGGPTHTHLPAQGSPVIDAGATALTADQRGETRPSGSSDDIGSVEVQSGPVPAIELVPEWAGLDTWIHARSLPVSGSDCGWTAGETVELYWDDSIILESFTADADGCFAGMVFLDGSERLFGEPFGTHKIVARGRSSTVTAQASFDLVPRQLHILPLTGSPGSPVSLSGCGWDPGTVVNVFWLDTGDLVGKGNVDSSGCMDTTGTIPRASEGFYALGATTDAVAPGDASGSSATVFEVANPYFTMAPTSGPPGTDIDLEGCNWYPGEQVTFIWDTTGEELGSFDVDAIGCLTSDLTDSDGTPVVLIEVPSTATDGQHVIRAEGGASGHRVERSFEVTDQWIELDPDTGTIFDSTVVTGCGWAGNTSVDFEWGYPDTNNHPIRWSHPVDAQTGCLSDPGLTIEIPDNTPANYSTVHLLATGDVFGDAGDFWHPVHSGTISVPDPDTELGATLTVDIHDAIIGETLQFRLGGGEFFDGVGAATTDFSYDVTLPTSGRVGTRELRVRGNKGFFATADINILDTSTISVPNYPVAPGMLIDVNGTNWSSGTRVDFEILDVDAGGDWELLLDDAEVGADTQDLNVSLRLPEDLQDGTHLLRAQGFSGQEASTQLELISPTLEITQPGASAGATLDVTGDHWGDGEPVRFTFQRAGVGGTQPLGSPVTGADDNTISTDVTLPYQIDDGSYVLIARGDSGRRATASFWVGERTLAFTISEVDLLDTALDGDVAPGDLYARIRVDAPGFPYYEVDFRDEHTTDILEADPRWTAMLTVPSSAPEVIPVEVSLFEWDSGDASLDDQVDVNSASTRESLVIPVSLTDGTWPGAPTNQLCYQGDDPDTAVEACIVTSVVSPDGDGDGDGLLDAWEIHGYDRDGDTEPELDLPDLGASPCRKTIGVDYSAMNARKPLQASIDATIAAFDQGDVDAPSDCQILGLDPEPGVELLVNRVTGEAYEARYGCGDALQHRDQTQDPIRSRFFHFAVFVNRLPGSSAGGVACGQGVVIISLGQPSEDAFERQVKESSTLMHELGHSIGLRHGGHENLNYKPNYQSVMNYRFALAGQYTADGSLFVLDYSREELDSLNEEALSEEPLTSADLETAWLGPDRSTVLKAPANQPVDWNDDGPTPADQLYAQDLNGDGWCVRPGPDGTLDTDPATDSDDERLKHDGKDEWRIAAGDDGICDTEADPDSDDSQTHRVGFDSLVVLDGFDDWSNLAYRGNYNRRGYGIGVEAIHPDIDDPTVEELEEQFDLWFSPSISVDETLLEASVGDVISNTGTFSDLDGDTVELTVSVGEVTKHGDGTWSWTHTVSEGPGRHQVTITAADGDEGSTSLTFAFDVVNTPPVIEVGSDEVEVQYSDTVVSTPVTVTDADSSPSDVTLSASGLPSGLSLSSLECVADDPGSSCSASIAGTATAEPGEYIVVLTADDGIARRSTSLAITVVPEEAVVRFHGGNPESVPVTHAGSDESEPFELMVRLAESEPDTSLSGDAHPGDLTKAIPEIVLESIGAGGEIHAETCETVRVDGRGYDAELTFRCSFDRVPVDTYSVRASASGYYEGETEDVLVVSDSTLGKARGAGSFVWPDTDDTVQFGFRMEHNQKGNRVKGSLMLLRSFSDGGRLWLKSNALAGMAVGDGWASFSGKATFYGPGMTDPEGNHEFLVYVEDDPGRFWIEVRDKDGQVVSSSSLSRPGSEHAVALNSAGVISISTSSSPGPR